MQDSLSGRSHSGKYALDFLYFPIKIVVVCFFLKFAIVAAMDTCMFRSEIIAQSPYPVPRAEIFSLTICSL